MLSANPKEAVVMALWMNRAGSRGEWEQNFLQDQRIYLQWTEIDRNLANLTEKEELRAYLRRTYSDEPEGAISSYLGKFGFLPRL